MGVHSNDDTPAISRFLHWKSKDKPQTSKVIDTVLTHNLLSSGTIFNQICNFLYPRKDEVFEEAWDKLRRQSERTEKRQAFLKVFQTSWRKTREEKKNACFSLGLFKILTAWFTGFVMSCDWLSAITRFQFYLSNSVLGAWVRLLFKVGKGVN